MSARTTRPGMPALTRRSLLGAAGGTTAALLLAACGTDTGDRYASGDSGYVSGSGVSTEIPAADRAEPLEFSGTSYDDEDLSAADLRGEVLVLNVWYASCPPCRKEAPDLQAIHEEYLEQGVSFLGVNVRDAAGPAQAFEHELRNHLPLAARSGRRDHVRAARPGRAQRRPLHPGG